MKFKTFVNLVFRNFKRIKKIKLLIKNKNKNNNNNKNNIKIKNYF